MLVTIDIDSDNDFYFLTLRNGQIIFPHEHECSTIEEGLEYIRDWIWDNSCFLYVNRSAERQKDHIKLHTGKRMQYIEKSLEKLYDATYNKLSKEITDCGFHVNNGNWSFSWKIK
jgi:hypothetical protein